MSPVEEYDGDEHIYPRPPIGRMRVQAVRSVCDWSQGVLTEHSIQNACQNQLLWRCMSMLMNICRHTTHPGSKPLHLYRFVQFYLHPFFLSLLMLFD